MNHLKKHWLWVAGVLTCAAVAIGGPVVADNDHKPPKAAIDKMKEGLVTPSEDGSGIIDPTKDRGAALILRDPETGDVLRDPDTGLPLVARDGKGNVRLFQPQEVPAEQRLAQARHDEKMQRAGKGDVQAQRELLEENEKTAKAIKTHPNGRR